MCGDGLLPSTPTRQIGLLRLAGERRKYQAESANDRRMGTSVEDGWRGV
jgi:hypothetical protein